jgi:hypothetical protein
LQAGTSVVLASTIAIVLPPFSFGFLKEITDICSNQNIVNTSKEYLLTVLKYVENSLKQRYHSGTYGRFYASITSLMLTQISNGSVKMV